MQSTSPVSGQDPNKVQGFRAENQVQRTSPVSLTGLRVLGSTIRCSAVQCVCPGRQVVSHEATARPHRPILCPTSLNAPTPNNPPSPHIVGSPRPPRGWWLRPRCRLGRASPSLPDSISSASSLSLPESRVSPVRPLPAPPVRCLGAALLLLPPGCLIFVFKPRLMMYACWGVGCAGSVRRAGWDQGRA